MKACATLSGLTEDIDVRFEWSDNSDAEALFDTGQNVLKISHIWLDLHLMHQRFPCKEMTPGGTADNDAPFLCDHIIEELLRVFLAGLFRPIPFNRAAENRNLRNIRQMLRYKPHRIKTMRSQGAGLTVIWKDNAKGSFRASMRSQAVYHVVLHKEKCPSVKSDCYIRTQVSSAMKRIYTCPRVTCQSC